MNNFQPFELERRMSLYEQSVEFNLTESGVHPIALGELVDDASAIQGLLATELNYPYVNGSPELREHIAALYPGASAENVLVTVGCVEANLITLQALVPPGEEIVVMLPNYLQIWGVAQNTNMILKTFHLCEENDWAPDLDELESIVSTKTRLIAVCNPNNPTGKILSEEEMDAIVSIANRVGAWILADEVYSGVELHTDTQTPTFWGRYDRVLAMNSMSKAYGLPGLRIGWVVAPEKALQEIWMRHEYTTISATMLGNILAARALSPEVRPRLIRRAREYARRGYHILHDWLQEHQGVFELVPPDASAIAFPRYMLDINSTELSERLRREKNVFIVPGDDFGVDHHVRISFGPPPDYLRAGLDRIHQLIIEIQNAK